MRPYEQIPLVGPGSELQLTLDGRAVPHVEVVQAVEAATAPPPPAPPVPAPVRADGQTRL